LTPVELTVTRIMLTPCPDRSRHSLLARGSIRRPSKTPALTLPSDQMGYGGRGFTAALSSRWSPPPNRSSTRSTRSR
jgi:hypothetical protein